MTNHPAGSATGIDLAALEQLAREYIAAQEVDRPSNVELNALKRRISARLDAKTVLSLIALARATPQHSVTDQASIGDDPEFARLLGAYGDCQGDDTRGALISYIDSRTQPPASTAATQPEQASIKTWRERTEVDKGRLPLTSYMEAEIADLRAALAIPASTVPKE